MNPTILLSLLLIGTSLVSAQSGLSACNVFCANTAVKNKTIGPSGSVDRTAYFFENGYFSPSVYEPQEGHCTLQAAFNDNQLTITGVVYDPANPTTGFFINIQSSRVNSGENYLELDSSAYVANGGSVDPNTWVHYTLNSGTLTGFGTWQGVTLSLAESMHPLQAGVGANGKNTNLGLSAWFEFQYNGQSVLSDINVDLVCPPPPPTAAPTPAPATDAPTSAPVTDAPTSAPVTDAPTSAPVTDAPTSAPVTDAPTQSPTSTPSTSGSGVTGATSTSGSSSSSGSDESYICPPQPYIARQSIADQYGGNSYFAFIFNTSTNIQYRFDFVNDNGRFKVNTDGTASLTGSLAPLSYNPQDGVFDFDFSAVVNFIPGSVPSEYHKELKEDAYVPNGPVDPSTWAFYAFSSATITPTNSRYSLSIAPFMDMEFQVGVGANGKNANYGASAWFSFFLVDNTNNVLVASGVMDINIDLVCTAPSSTSGSGSAGSGSGSDASTTSVVSDGSISGGEITPSTSASPSPATTASSASVVSTSVMMLVMLLAIALNL